MEAGHPVVAPLEHLRVRAELHGPAAGPAHFHGPHVHQLGTHGAAHSECAKEMDCTGVHSYSTQPSLILIKSSAINKYFLVYILTHDHVVIHISVSLI